MLRFLIAAASVTIALSQGVSQHGNVDTNAQETLSQIGNAFVKTAQQLGNDQTLVKCLLETDKGKCLKSTVMPVVEGVFLHSLQQIATKLPPIPIGQNLQVRVCLCVCVQSA